MPVHRSSQNGGLPSGDSEHRPTSAALLPHRAQEGLQRRLSQKFGQVCHRSINIDLVHLCITVQKGSFVASHWKEQFIAQILTRPGFWRSFSFYPSRNNHGHFRDWVFLIPF